MRSAFVLAGLAGAFWAAVRPNPETSASSDPEKYKFSSEEANLLRKPIAVPVPAPLAAAPATAEAIAPAADRKPVVKRRLVGNGRVLAHATVDNAMTRKPRRRAPPPYYPPPPPPPPNPPAGCTFGDGHGGHEQHFTHTGSMAQCRDWVQANVVDANGATWSYQDTRCYAEWGQTGAGGGTYWQNCPIVPVPSGCSAAVASHGYKMNVGHYSNAAEDCRQNVMSRFATATGMDYRRSNGECNAVFGQGGVHGSTEWINCPLGPLPAGCTAGDGAGGVERRITVQTPTMAACSAAVAIRYPSANAATWEPGGVCYAEFGQLSVTPSGNWINCVITPAFGASECQAGDGNGGMEISVAPSVSTMEECVNIVGKEMPSANGATWSPDGGCWAEMGQTGVRGPHPNYMNCPVRPTAPMGCSKGKGNGLEEPMKTTSTMAECLDWVSVRAPSANGASWQPGVNTCIAHMEQTGFSGNDFINCPITPTAPPGCTYGAGEGEQAAMMGTPTMHACKDVVKNTQPAANGASWNPTTQACTAQFGQTGVSETPSINCPVVPTCAPGDGIGGGEVFTIDTESIQECTDYVREHNPAANAATWGVENKHCFAEMGQTGHDDSAKWMNCPITPSVILPTAPPPPNVTCNFTAGVGHSTVGGEELFVDNVDSMQECAVAVAVHQPTANGATWGTVSRKCYAEFEQNAVENVTLDFQNCYVSEPAMTTPAPCVDATGRADLVYATKMDVLQMNEDLVAEAARMQRVLTDLRNNKVQLEADRGRLRVKYNSTFALCDKRTAQASAYEAWIDAEMDGLKQQCNRAEGLSSSDFQAHLTKVLDAVKLKMD